MKGEYVESKNENPNMFSKLHLNHPFSHHFQLSRESQAPDSAVAAAATPKDTSTNHNFILNSGGGRGGGGAGGSSGGDGATIEVVRRPRGRPPGSKNKPKPKPAAVVVAREPEPAMSPYLLEISGGNDVVEAVSRFSRRKNIGICVLKGSGTVSNVTLRQPSSSTPGATITFHGTFDILSLSATFLPQTTSWANAFTISLAGNQGQIVGGFVAGSLVAAGTVYILAATFNNPSYHRLPGGEEEEEARNTVSSGGGEGQSPPLSGGAGGADSCGVSMYSSHMGGSDVIWAPTARPPPPPPYQ